MHSLEILLGLICLILLITLLYKILKKQPLSPDPVLSKDKEEQFNLNCRNFKLSGRETEVTSLILRGWTYKAVAAHLFISEKTVDSHMQNIYTKTGARNKLTLMNLLYQ